MGIKITRKLLDNYRKYKSSIPVLEEELREMVLGDNGIDHSIILDYRTGEPRPQAVVGFDWELLKHRQAELENKKAKCAAVERWIRDIEDGQTRCVFRMFYIDGMTWEKIAMKTGYAGNPDYPRLMIRDNYLKKMGMK